MKKLSKFLVCGLIIHLFSACGIFKNARTYDKGVVINGVKWATRNVDEFGTFAKKPEDAGKYYQWNRKKPWNATETEIEDWDNSLPKGEKWEKTNDPCPKGWRVPTNKELLKLADAGSTWTILNGVSGRLCGSAPNQIFMPAAGDRNRNVGSNGKLFGVGIDGYYWSNSQYGSEHANLLHFNINKGGNKSQGTIGGKASALCVRCVAE